MNRLWCKLLENRHRGERAVLVCNGPSLRDMDLSFLSGETVIGLNKIYLGFNDFRFYPRYYVAVNRKVIEQAHQEIARLTCIKFVSNHCPKLVKDNALTHVINTHRPQSYFCKDITRGVHEGWTVTFAALQIAYYLGFKQVVIIGMDHRYKFVGEPNQAQVMEGADHNHFHKDYFGFGQNWDNPDLKNSEKSYSVARKAYEADGRKIIDATAGGACQVFEKADYRKLFRLA